VVTLYDIADLLTGPGCPVCRYAAEAGDRYLARFALEAHGDAGTITGLCSSLGMCATHTRGLMSQPGAATRLTAVYRYLMMAAHDRLAAGRGGALAPCPACEHDQGAARRALLTVVDGLAEDRGQARERYREQGGLCLPHLRDAASARGSRAVIRWLARVMLDGLAAGPAAGSTLAGRTGHDAVARARLRGMLPTAGQHSAGGCLACLAAAQAERDHLGRLPASAGSDKPADARWLCAIHLQDLALAGSSGGERVASEAAALAERMVRLPPRWLPGGGRAVRAAACAVCSEQAAAANQALRLAAERPTPRPLGDSLCVRHVLVLRAARRETGRAAEAAAAKRASALAGELFEAFRKSTWTYRHQAMGQEATAWQRAAAFLDGAVFAGCPPPGVRQRSHPDRPRRERYEDR
jgi:hypothetical protein